MRGSQKYLLPSLVSPSVSWELYGVTEMVHRVMAGGEWWVE